MVGGEAHWSGLDKRWTFPSGATITFGYLEHAGRRVPVPGPRQFQFVGFDELTQFEETPYRYLFSPAAQGRRHGRTATDAGRQQPRGQGSRVGAAASSRTATRAAASVRPAGWRTTPSLDRAEYLRALAELDPITRAQLLAGDWDAYQGGRFKKQWLRSYAPRDGPGQAS